MKREKLYCIIIALILSGVLLAITLSIVPTDNIERSIVVYLSYFAMIYSTCETIYKIIVNGITKNRLYLLLAGISGLIFFTSFLFGEEGKIEMFQNICITSFIIFLYVGTKSYTTN